MNELTNFAHWGIPSYVWYVLLGIAVSIIGGIVYGVVKLVKWLF